MFLKNTFNVFSSNFTLTFRLLGYKIIIAALCAAIGFSTILPLFQPVLFDMQEAGIYETLTLVSRSASEFTLFSDSVSAELLQAVNSIKDILVYHYDSMQAIYFAFCGLLLIWYLSSSAIDIAMSEVINYFCKQKSKRSLVACFITRFVDVCKYTFFKLCLILPVELCILAIAFGIYILNIGGIFSTALAISFIYLLWPLKNVFICLFAPCIVNSNGKIFDSFKHGCELASKKWIKIYSSNLFIMIVGLMFLSFASITSLGALALYSVAIYSLYFKCYSFVVYYNIEGVRFYSDSETIITPYIVKVQEGDYIVDLL